MQYSQLKSFPTNFMWGASTSAYQCDGAQLATVKVYL